MKISTLFILSLTLMLFVGCSRRATKPTIDPGSVPYRGALEAALSEPGGTYSIPLGEVQISEVERPQGDQNVLGAHWLGVIHGARKKNLIEFSEVAPLKKASDCPDHRVRTFSIRPTERLLALADKSKNRPNMAQITIFRAEITEIAQDILYEGPLARVNDEHRLVVGKYRWSPTEECQELHAGLAQAVDSRFRAVLKIDPFNRTYSVLAKDSGLVDQESWTTAHVQ